MFLTKFATKVHLIHRRQEFRASKIMQDRARANEKIAFVLDSRVTDVLGADSVEAVLVENVLTGETATLPVHGLFVAIGHVPNTELFKGWLEMEDTGYLVTKHGSTFTNIDGVFAAGDVQDHVYRQAITAAGSGCMAAIDAERWLEATHSADHEINETPRNW
jgi:thioredoxin reductase (NADPH)